MNAPIIPPMVAPRGPPTKTPTLAPAMPPAIIGPMIETCFPTVSFIHWPKVREPRTSANLVGGGFPATASARLRRRPSRPISVNRLDPKNSPTASIPE